MQSIANMCRALYKEYEFFIFCSNKDLDEQQPLPGIKSDCWNDFEHGVAKVYYVSKKQEKASVVKHIINEVQPDYVFVNGIFLFYYSMLPLLLSPQKKIFSARGMLHPQALSQKSAKKKLFISLVKVVNIPGKVVFHATDQLESEYIKNVFGNRSKVMVAQNFPKHTGDFKQIKKTVHELRLVSIAVISPMKNIKLVLQALKEMTIPVYYDIYGPVMDKNYWSLCLSIIETMPSNIIVHYRDSVMPDKVADTLAQYHFFILPSKSENFGHALYESLASGRPIITSKNTPWTKLSENKAGWNVDISSTKELNNVLSRAAAINDEDYQTMCTASIVYSNDRINIEDIKQQYRELFK